MMQSLICGWSLLVIGPTYNVESVSCESHHCLNQLNCSLLFSCCDAAAVVSSSAGARHCGARLPVVAAAPAASVQNASVAAESKRVASRLASDCPQAAQKRAKVNLPRKYDLNTANDQQQLIELHATDRKRACRKNSRGTGTYGGTSGASLARTESVALANKLHCCSPLERDLLSCFGGEIDCKGNKLGLRLLPTLSLPLQSPPSAADTILDLDCSWATFVGACRKPCTAHDIINADAIHTRRAVIVAATTFC